MENNFKDDVLNVIETSTNSKEQFQQFQYKKFKENWIVDIESFLPSLMRITKDLRSNLKYEEEVLPVEKTRRVTSESIRHLLRNTRYISQIEENEGVIPDQVLNALSEIDYGIYENRFIMTLIERLNNYLASRIEILKENLHGFRETYYKFKNEFEFNYTKFGININMIAIEDLNLEELDLHNHIIYERTIDVYQQVTRLYNSDFMRIMKKYPKVKPPIMKTQIILKNPDFRNAYLLWIYLDSEHSLDYTLESETRNKIINKDYENLLNEKIQELFSSIYDNTNFGKVVKRDERLEKISTRPIKMKDQYVGNLKLDDVPLYDLEPNLATEFYLEKASELLKESFNKIARRAESKEESFKQVLLDQYSIADQVFEYFFQINQDNDVFDELMKHRDPVKRYYEAYDKFQIVKAASEIRELIFKKSLLLEERWLKEVLKLEAEAKAEIRRRKQLADLKFNELKEEMIEEKQISEAVENKHKIDQLNRQKNISQNQLDETLKIIDKTRIELTREQLEIDEKKEELSIGDDEE